MKELRISATINVPDDAFEQAELLGKIVAARTEFAAELSKAVGSTVTVDARVVTPVARTKKAEPAAPVAAPHHIKAA